MNNEEIFICGFLFDRYSNLNILLKYIIIIILTLDNNNIGMYFSSQLFHFPCEGSSPMDINTNNIGMYQAFSCFYQIVLLSTLGFSLVIRRVTFSSVTEQIFILKGYKGFFWC